jgi:hypothetical protein
MLSEIPQIKRDEGFAGPVMRLMMRPEILADSTRWKSTAVRSARGRGTESGSATLKLEEHVQRKE